MLTKIFFWKREGYEFTLKSSITNELFILQIEELNLEAVSKISLIDATNKMDTQLIHLFETAPKKKLENLKKFKQK